MKDTTFKNIWDNVIKVQAKAILEEDRIINSSGKVDFNADLFDNKKEDVKNEYDNIRGYSKFAYLKDPDGLSNRYLVSTYIILAIAKIKPLDAGENEGTLKNEKLAIRTGFWAICLFNSYQAQNSQKQDGWKKLSKELGKTLKELGDDFENRLYYHLYYDINDKKYNILEMANIVWLLEVFLENKNGDVNKRKELLECLSRKKLVVNTWDRSIDLRWDSIWSNIVSQVATEIVDKYKGRVEFDKTSKYTILYEYMTLINESKDNYVKLSDVYSDKYMISACFILAIAKSQPLRYTYDIHAKKGVYNENLALEAGLRLLYEFRDDQEGNVDSLSASPVKYTTKSINTASKRYAFPKPFHNKAYKELLCLMLHYDIRENRYSVLAISNILYMIEIYTNMCSK